MILLETVVLEFNSQSVHVAYRKTLRMLTAI